MKQSKGARGGSQNPKKRHERPKREGKFEITLNEFFGIFVVGSIVLMGVGICLIFWHWEFRFGAMFVGIGLGCSMLVCTVWGFAKSQAPNSTKWIFGTLTTCFIVLMGVGIYLVFWNWELRLGTMVGGIGLICYMIICAAWREKVAS